MQQKGLVAYHLLDGDPDWLRRQQALEGDFLDRLAGPGRHPRMRTRCRPWSRSAPISSSTRAERAGGRTLPQRRHGGRRGPAPRGAPALRLADRAQRAFKQFHTDRSSPPRRTATSRPSGCRLISLAAIFSSAGLTRCWPSSCLPDPGAAAPPDAGGYRAGVPARSETKSSAQPRGPGAPAQRRPHPIPSLSAAGSPCCSRKNGPSSGSSPRAWPQHPQPVHSVKMRMFSLGDPRPGRRQKDDFDVICGRNPAHRHHRPELPRVLAAAEAPDAARRPVRAWWIPPCGCWSTG